MLEPLFRPLFEPLLTPWSAFKQGAGVTPLGPTTLTTVSDAAVGSQLAAITGLGSGETVTSFLPNDGRIGMDGGGTNLIVGLAGLTAGFFNAVLTTSTGRSLTIAVTVNHASSGYVDPATVFTWAAFGLSAPGGVPQSSFDITTMRPAIGKEYMVSYTGGNDANAGTSWAAPLKTVSAALAKTDWDTITIDEAAGVGGSNRWYGAEASRRATSVSRNGLIRTRNGGRVMLINSRNPTSGAYVAPTWVLHSGSIYKTSSPTVTSAGLQAIDLGIVDADGFPAVYPDVASLAALTVGTCFRDSATSTFYVWPQDGRSLVGSQDLIISDSSNTFTWAPPANGGRLYMENIDLIGGVRTFRTVSTTAGWRHELCMSNVRVIGGQQSNTYAITGGFDCYLVDTHGVGGDQDVFNYHYDTSSGEHPRVFELRCKTGYCGYDGSGANNGSTTHYEGTPGVNEGGGRIVRALGIYRGSADRTIHDLGPETWLFGCRVEPPKGPVVAERSVIRSGPKNKMWVDRCTLLSGSDTTADLYNADGGYMFVSNSTDISGLTARGEINRYAGV